MALVDNVTSPSSKKNENARAVFYKKPIKKGNYKLEIEYDETPQEVRRQRLLQFQKKCRDVAFNTGRGILEDAFNSEDENEDEMEVEENGKHKTYRLKRFKHYANQLMMSEWMLDVPQDFSEKWVMVPCPEGKRTLVVACKGMTQAYNRHGLRVGKFHSALPGGSPDQHKSRCTIIDCIWIKKHKIYYVIDVLAWSNQPLLNCDTDFRFFWLKSQLLETQELQERDTYRNTFPILPLPNISCESNLSTAFGDFLNLLPLDGLLFYHRDGHYTKGCTPLVTWLKTFMLPEVLGISIPPPFDDKPDDYMDFRHYIHKNTKKKKKVVSDNTMEIVDNHDDNDDTFS